MAKGRFTLDQETHADFVENAPKIRQAEWAKFLAWAPVVEGIRRWTSTVLLAIIAAGKSGTTVRKLTEMLDISKQHMRSRFIILEEFGIISSKYEKGTLVYRQRLSEIDWPDWVTPPVWALVGSRTKGTVKVSKKLYTIVKIDNKTKVHNRPLKIKNLIKHGIYKLDKVLKYHKEQAELQRKPKQEKTDPLETDSEILQEFDTGFEPVKLRTKKVKNKSVKHTELKKK